VCGGIEMHLFPMLLKKRAPFSMLIKVAASHVLYAHDEETRQTSMPKRVKRSRGSGVPAQLWGDWEAWLHGSLPMKWGQAERDCSRCGSAWPWRKKLRGGLLQYREV